MLKEEKLLISIHILIAEDASDIRLLMTRLLARQGATVVGAKDGLDAIAKVKSADVDCAFDIILMDLQMPIMGGHEAARLIRVEGFSGPIIALTGHSMEFAQEQDNAFDFDGYLLKPVSTQKLIDKILQHCPAKIAQTSGAADGEG